MYIGGLNLRLGTYFGDTSEEIHDTQMCRDTIVENHCCRENKWVKGREREEKERAGTSSFF